MSKRKRPTIAKSQPSQSDEKHEIFTIWAQDRGVEINGVKPERLPGRGLGLITTKRLKSGERILFIPEKAMFQPDAAMLERENLKNISPQAQLAMSALMSFRTDQSSLKVWQDTWPTLDDFNTSMPMCWGWTGRQQWLLPPPHQPLERQIVDYRKDWGTVRGSCANREITEDDFKYYWLIVNSRSFHWRPGASKAGSMVMCPFIDYLNHGPTGSTCRVTMTAKGYEVCADRIYEPGEEVLATYGAHSNDKLLVHYGFICAHTSNGPSPDDDIRLDHLILPKLTEEIRDQLQDVGFLGGYALLPAKNELCFKTQVAVRAMTLTCNEWEYFVASGEDLSVDHTADINAYVKALLAEYREEGLKYRKAAADIGAAVVEERWGQIIDAIDQFSKV